MNVLYVQKVNVRSDSEQKNEASGEAPKNIFSKYFAEYQCDISILKEKHSRRTAICPIVLCAHTSNQV